MSDDPKKPPSGTAGTVLSGVGAVATAGTIGTPGSATFRGVGAVAAAGEIALVSIRQLPQAIKENRPEIIVTAPTWWPSALLYALVVFVVVFYVTFPGILELRGLSLGYNVELCPKIIYKGAEISHCAKLTKPNVQTAPTH
jgi:hypothetical protein